MGRSKVTLLPQQEKRLSQMGEQIKLARLRRQLPIELVAERAGISRQSVTAVEKGSPSVSLGIYANVLLALGLQGDLLLIAKDDVLGRPCRIRTLSYTNAPQRSRRTFEYPCQFLSE